ncbi:hypothetical protein TURU_151383 [Turdus rufiventris]|nr:hypothetical protein TURU_151383 [Turdus rufiventris]
MAGPTFLQAKMKLGAFPDTPLRILIFTISWSWQPRLPQTFTSLSSSFFVIYTIAKNERGIVHYNALVLEGTNHPYLSAVPGFLTVGTQRCADVVCSVPKSLLLLMHSGYGHGVAMKRRPYYRPKCGSQTCLHVLCSNADVENTLKAEASV